MSQSKSRFVCVSCELTGMDMNVLLTVIGPTQVYVVTKGMVWISNYSLSDRLFFKIKCFQPSKMKAGKKMD